MEPEAYDLFLKAQQEKAWSFESTERAISYLEQSIQKDPEYAPSHAALASFYSGLAIAGLRKPTEILSMARKEAMRAIELDSALAVAYSVLGTLKYRFDWDFSGGESNIRRAISLNENSLGAHSALAYYLSCVSRFDESVKEALKAEQLDPNSTGTAQTTALEYYFQGRYDQAIEKFDRAIELGGNSATRLAILASCYVRKGMNTQSLACAEQGRKLVLPGVDQMADAYLADPFSRNGKTDQVLEWINNWTLISKQRYVDGWLMAIMIAPTGNRDITCEWLERGYKERSPNMPWIKKHPSFDRISSDPRFQDLVRKMNFPEK